MKRALLLLAFAVVGVATPLMSATASAVKPSQASITLTCDRGTSSTAIVTLFATSSFDSQLGDPITVNCNAANPRSSVTVDLHDVAKFASIGPWSYSKGGGLVGQCGGGVALPANVSCGDRNFGAKLQIR